ncbi:MAG: HAMP domain-containing histidine kinase [Burkholderiaceae bacterium]|nr:HAMP domain-containing histidine kinase [Microbacteriaceae bacterium]
MRQRWTLRRRLVLSVIALLAVASIAIGIVSVAALLGTLTGQLDDQLTAATGRSQVDGNRPGDSPGQGAGGIRPEFIQVGTVSAAVIAGSVVSYLYLDDSGTAQTLSRAQLATLGAVASDGRPRSIHLEALGDYRVVSKPAGSGAILVGLPLAPLNSIVLQLIVTIAIVSALGVALAGLAGTWIVRLALRPLDRVAATASHVAELPLDKGEVALAVRVSDDDADPRTEVGQVGAALNRMLEHVASALSSRQESERKVRQFVADASHELRTPLTSIRGYAELTRRSSHELPPDVVHSIGRVESEAKRMTSLVEDLLLLARLDEGRDLETEPVDLSRLLIDAIGDAHVAGPDHHWSLDLPDEPVIAPGDGLRLHQVIANLLANARTHTPAGTEVTVALSSTADVVTITVSDTGPGIPQPLLSELFERFARGDGSRSRLAGSTGLGLAIVRAVVEGHGGAANVASVPGDTAFTVTLPANQPAFRPASHPASHPAASQGGAD